ncbi:uncharacterized protein LOC126827793 [Patella vulgata]|uniref:uncharacterized protein LOC126827793 n=1 Tax=Patella vulgata TaxID=6465 RepID=UPI00217F5887|nr:uncharacterized protein LOC126827793 [Patella vulgata]
MGILNSISAGLFLFYFLPLAYSAMEVTYEEDKQNCPYFLENKEYQRFAVPTHGLVNCSWYSHKACCKRTEVTSVFSKMYPLYEATKTCSNMMNYLMCYFCSPDQHIWYKQRARVCTDFCTNLFEECKSASYNGKKLGSEYENGTSFCEAQDFSVVEGNCFKYDPKVFDGAVQHISFYLPYISSLIMILTVLII